jgi:hypothetical protein
MAYVSLPDCNSKQNPFLHRSTFLAEIESFLVVIFSSPLHAMMICGSKITTAIIKKVNSVLGPRAI